MFHFIKERKWKKYTRAAQTYVEENFIEEQIYVDFPTKEAREQGPGTPSEELVKYSSRNTTPRQKIKYSSRDSQEAQKIKYSSRNENFGLKDQYNEKKISYAMSKYGASFNKSALLSALSENQNTTFVEYMLSRMKFMGFTNTEVYKAAQLDRRLFSKIVSDRFYKPSKDTALAIVIALHLRLDQAKDLLDRAGYTLSHSCKRDIIIEYFIRECIFNLNDINETLYRLDEKIIGRQMSY